MLVQIEKLDHQGQGIAFVNNKVTFVPKAVVGDILDIKIVKSKKNYQVGEIVEIKKASSSRVDAFCPYYNLCGGCDLQNLKYTDTLTYKKEKIMNIFSKINLNVEPIIISNPNKLNYRNKIELQVQNKKIGFFKENTHEIIPIDSCAITMESINKVLKNLKKLNITNGKITIRSNQNNELLIIIHDKTLNSIDINLLKDENKISGVILNNKLIYGEPFLINIINNLVFRISYDSFFQVNYNVAAILFDLITENITQDDQVLDLYSGVGTLSLSALKKAKSVVGVEIVPNAVLNAIDNAKINKMPAKFLLNDVEEAITKIKLQFNTFIIDPPRSGLDKTTLGVIMNYKPKKVIYVSCDPQTLVRDLATLKEKYTIQKLYILDMFSYTYHIETFCVLNLR